jgi:GT2 family glycosyltransferase
MDKTLVIILHYKNITDTISCLKSLRISKKKESVYKILIVSNSGNIEKDLDVFKEANFIANKKNLGFSGGVNEGIRWGMEKDFDNFIIVNNDVIASYSSIIKIIEFSNNNENAGIVSPKIYFAPGFEYYKSSYRKNELGKVIWYAGGLLDWKNMYASHRGVDEIDIGQYQESINTDFATGCMMLIKRKVIEKVGYFDEKYFLYYEDVDYSIRVKKHGFEINYFPDSVIWHKNAVSSGNPGSTLHDYYQTRNRLYFGMKYASFRTKKSLIIEALRMISNKGIKNKAVKDYFCGRMGEEQ